MLSLLLECCYVCFQYWSLERAPALILAERERAVSGRLIFKRPHSGTVSPFRTGADYDTVFPSWGKYCADVSLLKRVNGCKSLAQII